MPQKPITLKSSTFFLEYTVQSTREHILIKEYKSWRTLLLCTIRQFRGAQRNINYEEVLTADDNTDMYALMLNDGMRDFAGSRRRVLDI
jgi:hypothetical protein